MDKNDATIAPPNESSEFDHIAGDISLVDYVQAVTFLPDLTKLVPNKLDYAGENVVCPAHTEAQRAQLVGMLQKHE